MRRYSISGVLAWVIWRTYYLLHLPTLETKIRIGISWAINLFFGTDLTRIGETKMKNLHKVEIDDTPSLKDQLLSDL